MLETLRIKNLAIFKEAEFNLSEGLVVLTGQTGAGKSITLKALELIGGARGSSELIRSGAESAEVEALFILEKWAKDRIEADFEDIAESLDGDELLIRRVIKHSGRGKIYINGSLKTRAELEHLTPLILDITAQHYQQTLLNSKNHRELLDSFGVDRKLIAKVSETFSDWKFAKDQAENYFKESSEKQEYLRRIQFEFEELDAISLQPGEKEALELELSREENLEFLKAAAFEGLELLDSPEAGLIRKLSSLRNKLEESAKLDNSFREALSLIESSELQLVEVVRELEEKSAGLDLDPESLEEKRSRLAEIKRLERKYSRDSEELVVYAKGIADELEKLSGGALDQKQLEEKVSEAFEKYKKAAKALSKSREGVAKLLSKEVETELISLDMKRARFEVQVGEGEASRYGSNAIEFLFSANPGEPLKPLQKVASGGELSRLVLILKVLLNQKNRPGLQVFDEVDVGVGGATAQVIGEKLKRIAETAQVIVVTHAPQIAAMGSKHFSVSKTASSNETFGSLQELDSDERVGEIARMLAGKKVTEKFIDSAKELIKTGR